MDKNRIRTIVNEVFNKVLNEAPSFKQGESIVINGSEALGRKIIRAKYGLNPDDFEYVGSGKFVYKLKNSNKNKRTAQPKKQKEFLGRKEGETEQEYLERVRELNPSFASVESELPGEEWRPVVNKGRYYGGNTDYQKSYEVSNMGRIRIIDYEDPMRSRISSGYDAPGKEARNFHLDIPGFKTTPPIHTLVADAWLPEPPGGIENYYVAHIDGNYHNNRADNLEYRPKKKGGDKGPDAAAAALLVNPQAEQGAPLAESARRMIKESVRRALNEMEDYPQDFRNWLNDPKHYGFYRYFDEMPQSQKNNVYQAYQEEMAEKNFTDGMRVGNRQGFKNDKGEIEWHGNGTINGWRSSNSKWTPQESELNEMISKIVKRTLNEVSGWTLEKDDVAWVNDAESGASDKAWMVRLWSGSGYYLPAFGAYATSEEDALEKVVAYLDQEGDDSFFCDDYVEQMKEELAQEGKDDEDIWQEIDEQFCYVDSTMDGGGCHYILWENLAVYPYDEKRFR